MPRPATESELGGTETKEMPSEQPATDFRIRNLSDVGVLITMALFIYGLFTVWQTASIRLDRVEQAQALGNAQQAVENDRREKAAMAAADAQRQTVQELAMVGERMARIEARLDDWRANQKP